MEEGGGKRASTEDIDESPCLKEEKREEGVFFCLLERKEKKKVNKKSC